MMRTMRAFSKWIMLVVAVAFVGWMIFEVGMDATGRGAAGMNVIAKVNGQSIDAQMFYTAVRNEQERIRAEGGALPVTLEEYQALENQVLEQLVQSILLQQEYRRRGIRVSDQDIVDAARTSPPPELLEAPQFQTEGQFDIQKYQRFVASSADPTFLMALEARYRDELPRLRFYQQLAAGVFVTDAELWRQYRDLNDSVTAVVLALFAQTVVPDSEVALSEEEIETYYRQHRDEFERPATAYLSFISLSRQPNAADSAAALERAVSVHAELTEGADFADVARRESSDSISAENGGDLGEVPRGRFISEFERAALALRPGEISEPIPTQFGYHIIRLESSTDTTLHASHVLIPVELAGDHLDEVETRADTLDLFAAEQVDPLALDDVAARLGISVATAPLLFEGDRLQLGPYLVGDAGVWAFGGAQAGETSPVIETQQMYYVFRLDSLTEAGVPTLARAQDEVRLAALQAKKRERVAGLARQIADLIETGVSLEDAAEQHGLETQTLGPFTRYSPPPAFQGAPSATGAAFAMGVGETGGPITSLFATYFVRPTRKTLADSSAFVAQLEIQRGQALNFARQQRLQYAMASLRRRANVQDLRLELQRAQREAEARAPNQGPLGF